MKKIENSFAVTGRIRRDAEIHLFEIVKVAHFSIAVSYTHLDVYKRQGHPGKGFKKRSLNLAEA